MAGIQGQPAPRPSDVQAPVPGASTQSVFDSVEPQMAQAAGKSASVFDAGQTAPPQQMGVGEGLARSVTNALPTVGATVGATVSAAAGPEAIPLGLYTGGMLGAGLKEYVNNVVFGDKKSSIGNLNKVASEAEKQTGMGMLGASVFGAPAGEAFAKSGVADIASPTVAGTAVGLTKKAVLEAATRITKAPEDVIIDYFHAPQRVKDMAVKYNGNLPEAANGVRSTINQSIDDARTNFEGPLRKSIADRITALTPEGYGDQAKQALVQTINDRHGPFLQAYDALDQVSKSMPIQDEQRRKFGVSLSDWALKEFPQNTSQYKSVKQYKDMFEASNTGAQFDNVVKNLSDDIRSAYAGGRTDEAKFLSELKTKANDFLENQVTNIAKRVQTGRGNPDEMNVIQQMAQNQGIQEPEPGKYAKAIASDYLKGKDTIKSDYSSFSRFLDDIQEQTRTSARGANSTIAAINDVPSEKLMQRMTDPKNAAALRSMKTQTPEVFQQVQNYHTFTLVNKSTVDGVLDLNKLADNIEKVPIDTRRLLYPPDDMAGLNSIVKDPKYERFNQLVKETAPMLTDLKDPAPLVRAGRAGTNESNNLVELSKLTGKNLVSDVQALSGMAHFGQKGMRLSDQSLKKGIDVVRALSEFGQSAAKKTDSLVYGSGQ